MNVETKYNMAKSALIAVVSLAFVISWGQAVKVQDKINARKQELLNAGERYEDLHRKVRSYEGRADKRMEVSRLKSQMDSIDSEYLLYDGYKDKVINGYENTRFFWMAILVWSFMGLGQLFKPVRWLMYAVLAGAGINMLRNNN